MAKFNADEYLSLHSNWSRCSATRATPMQAKWIKHDLGTVVEINMGQLTAGP